LIGVELGLMLFKKLRGKALEARRKKNVSELIQLKKTPQYYIFQE